MRATGLAVVVLAACGGGSSGGATTDLAERLRALLVADGRAVEGDVEEAEVLCPTVARIEAGDLATCVLTFDGGREVEVDVAFDADGAITVVAVQER